MRDFQVSSSSSHATSTDFTESLSHSLSLRLYHPSSPAGLPNFILCWHKEVLPGRPTLAQPWVVYGRMSLMSSSLFLQRCPTYLVHLTWMFFGYFLPNIIWKAFCFYISVCRYCKHIKLKETNSVHTSIRICYTRTKIIASSTILFFFAKASPIYMEK